MTVTRLARHKTLAALAALVLAAGGGAGALAGTATGQDTSAVAVNTKDGSTVFKLKFNILQVNGDTVDNGNAAVSYASCNLCQTVAISIQVLLVASDPSVFDPTNIAIAYNENCTLCDTLATAYQFAVGLGYRLKFTADGRREIAAIRQELDDLRHSGLSGTEIQDRLDSYMQQLSTVLSTELVGVSEPASGSDQAQPTSATTQPGDTPTQPAPATTDTQPTTSAPAATAPADTTTTTTEPAPATTDTTSTTPTQTETTPTTTDTTSTTPGG